MILNEMQRRGDAGDVELLPDAITYTLAIRACYSSGDRGRAKSILERMEAGNTLPTTRLYNAILNHFAQIGSALAAQRVEGIISHMHYLGKTKPRLKPDVYSYNILLSAWARSNDSPTLVTDRVWKILKQMRVNRVAPDLVTYNQSIALLARSFRRRDVMRAEALLQRLVYSEDLQPNTIHYFNVARGWLRQGHLQDAARVMLRQANQGSAMTDDLHHYEQAPGGFDFAMLRWIQAGDLLQATELINQQQRLFNQNRLDESPSLQSYERLLDAWSQSDDPQRHAYITSIKRRIEEMQKE